MSAILRLVQGTPEWHNHRSQYRNASETPAVLGISPWMTPYDLWLVKTGRKTTVENEAMKHGSAMEPEARAVYEQETGLVMQPKVVVDGLYSASLDGMTLDGKLILEVKCPFQGQTSELWQVVESGKVPEHYRLQVQHQLMVSGANLAHLWVYSGNQGIKLEIAPDLAEFDRIQLAWDAFQPYLINDSPPPLTEQDTVLREDQEWQEAVEAYLSWRSTAEEAASKADEAKARLVSLTQHCRESGHGVTVTRYWKQGDKEEVRVTIARGVGL